MMTESAIDGQVFFESKGNFLRGHGEILLRVGLKGYTADQGLCLEILPPTAASETLR